MLISPHQAGSLMRRLRQLVSEKRLRAHHTAAYDYLLFLARPHGSDRCQVSYAAMQRNLHLRRERLVEAIRDLEAAGLLRKVRSWVWVEWQGLRVKRQATNTYVFPTLTPEFRGRTAIRVDFKKEAKKEAQEQRRPASPPVVSDGLSLLERVLASLGEAVAEREAREAVETG